MSDELQTVGRTERGEPVLRGPDGQLWVRESDRGLRVLRGTDKLAGTREERPSSMISAYGQAIVHTVRGLHKG
jgi:hypothetical protein